MFKTYKILINFIIKNIKRVTEMKKKQVIAGILAISFVVGSINFYIFDVGEKMLNLYATTKQDNEIAQALADISGQSKTALLKQKNETGSWNDVVSDLNNTHNTEKMSIEELERLIAEEGYSEDEVSNVKLIVEQLLMSLEEIVRSTSTLPELPNTLITNNQKNISEESNYQKIGDLFDKNLIIYLALKLKDDFGSVQAVIDEYLYCLQVDVDLRLYIADKKVYEKLIVEKSAQLVREEAITMDDISNYMIEKLQQKNEGIYDSKKVEIQKDDNIERDTGNILPSYTPEDPRPQDPTKEIMDEINKINQSWR